MATRKFWTAYDRTRGDIADYTDTSPSLTQQHFKDECDINNIMKHYTESGLLPTGTAATAVYGDFSTVEDYLTALNTIDQATDQFNQLPSKVRDRFRNDPAELLDFILKPENKAEAQAIGLLASEPPPPAPAAPPPPAAPQAKP